jgi:hydroxyacylglutathione hydrolase
MIIEQISDSKLAHFAYLLGCQQTGKAILIDPQRDISRYLAVAARAKLTIVAVAETHIHADYLSGLRQFAELLGVTVYASDEGGTDWRYEWLTGSTYSYKLLHDKDSITVGNIRLDVRHTPGHTPEHVAYLVTDLSRNSDQPIGIVSGDFVFVGDVGRPDLLERAAKQAGTMENSAGQLFDSLQQFKHLPQSLLLWPGHGAGSACGKSLGAVPISTVGYELTNNVSISAAGKRRSFVEYIVNGQPEPPTYFARMKKENREGPAILERIPEPEALSATEIAKVLAGKKHVVVDTRSWEEYRAGHLPGALFIPLDKNFTGVVGSYVLPTEQICLVVESSRVEEAAVDCIRVGLDRVTAHITPDQLKAYFELGLSVARADWIPMAELSTRIGKPDVFLLDVRRRTELVEGGSIAGAHNIAHLQLSERHVELPRDKNIHVFCQGVERSRQAFGCLERFGYATTYVEGGFGAWKAMGNSIESLVIKSVKAI